MRNDAVILRRKSWGQTERNDILQYKLTIPGLLPGLNEYINAERANKHKAAAMKRQSEHVIGFMIKSQLRGVRFNKPVVIHYRWFEPNRRRDKDNIAFAKKFIQDALVHCGVLQNDGWNHVEHFTDDFEVDKKNPRVEVVIEEFERSGTGGKKTKHKVL